MNKVILFGNLGADPELKMTNSGTAVMSLRLATSSRQKKGDEWIDVTEWHSVTVWGKRAEALSKILNKGDRILVEGELRTRSWEDQDGNKKYRTEVNAVEVELSGKRDGQGSGGGNGGDDRARSDRAPQQSTKSGRREAAPVADDDDDDIPF